MNIRQHSANHNTAGELNLCGHRTGAHFTHTLQTSIATGQEIIFGPFQLDRTNAILTRDHEPLILTPKAFSLLCYLVDSAGQLLTKDAIFTQIWPRVVVSDAALSVCIREIRKVLGDSSKNPRYVETVHKRGFRFIGEVSKPSDNDKNYSTPISVQQSTAKVVGRDKPLGLMQKSLQNALMGGRQMVFITGEPGIGKTTTAEVFLQQNLQNNDVWIAKGQCIEHYGASEAYLPVLDALGGLARNFADELSATLCQYAPTWLEHLPELNAPLASQQPDKKPTDVRPERMLREITRALEAIAEKRLLVLILEDLHWSDHATIDLLSFLARRDNPVRLLIIATYRPADAGIQNHPVKGLKQDLQLRERCTTIPLEFLDQQQILLYLAEVFPGHDFPEQFSGLIHQQSGGNPLFMVNLLKYLQNSEFLKNEAGQWQLMDKLTTQGRCIPDDLELMINHQVEELDLECKKLLEVASIASEPGGIAVQFTLTEVSAALGIDELQAEHCLEGLVRNGHFLNSLGVTEWPDGTYSNNYEFTHALYQNVIYKRVSTVRKMQIHQQLGLRLEKGYGSRNMEIANQLAVHFEFGRDYFRTVQYLKKTAEIAARRGANREAIHTLEKAQHLLEKLPESLECSRLELSLLLLLGPAITASQGNATPEIETCYLRARKLCEQLNEQSEQFRVLFGLRSFYLIRGDLDKAHQLAKSLLELASELNNSDYLLEAQVGLASSEFFAGNLRASYQHALQGIALYDKETHVGHAALYGLDPGVFCYARAGQTAWPLGYPDQALKYEKQAVELAETLDHPYSLVFAIHNLTQVLLYRHDGDAALVSAERGKVLALQHGFSFLSAWAFHLSAWAYAMVGDSNKARLEIKQALVAERPKAPAADTFLAIFLAETFYLLGDFENGLSSLAVPVKEHSYDVERLYLEAEFLLMSDATNETSVKAEALFKEALQISRQQGFESYELRITSSLRKLLLRQKSSQELHQCLFNISGGLQEDLDTIASQQTCHSLELLNILPKNDQQAIKIDFADSAVSSVVVKA